MSIRNRLNDDDKFPATVTCDLHGVTTDAGDPCPRCDDDAATARGLDIGDCTCILTCSGPDRCSHSGVEFHVHPQDERGVTGPCPLHPDAPGDL